MCDCAYGGIFMDAYMCASMYVLCSNCCDIGTIYINISFSVELFYLHTIT